MVLHEMQVRRGHWRYANAVAHVIWSADADQSMAHGVHHQQDDTHLRQIFGEWHKRMLSSSPFQQGEIVWGPPLTSPEPLLVVNSSILRAEWEHSAITEVSKTNLASGVENLCRGRKAKIAKYEGWRWTKDGWEVIDRCLQTRSKSQRYALQHCRMGFEFFWKNTST